MANLNVLDGAGVIKYLKSTGAGTDGDPFILDRTTALPPGAATAANQTTIIGHVDGVEALLTTMDADTSALSGTVSGAEIQVDVVAALPAGTNAIGKLAANSGVDIGDVDILSLPALPAGTNTIGATRDAGPVQTVTRTYTASANMTTAADITVAPTNGQKIVAMDIVVSTDTAMNFSIQEETSATVFAKVFLPANGSVQITLRGYLKAAVADKKLLGKASVAGNVAITMIYYSEV